MKHIFVALLYLAVFTASAQIIPIGGHALPRCAGGRTTNCAAWADSSGNVAIAAAALDHGASPVNIASSSKLAKFRSALAKGTASIVVVGDSVGEGYTATTQRVNGWAYLMASRIKAAYGDAGPGFLGAHRTDLYTFSGTWTAYASYGADAKYATGSANTVALSAQICSSFKVIWMGNAQIDVQVDGGEWATLDGTLPANGNLLAATVSAGSLGSHTLAIRPTGSTTPYFHGVIPIVSATGVTVHNLSISGASSGTFGGGVYQTNVFANLLPDIVIVALGINDAGSSVTAENYTTYIGNITTRAATFGSSVLILGENPTTRTGTAADNTIQAAQLALAFAGGFDYVNVVDRWGSYTAANAAGLMADALHPNNAGHLDIADYVTGHLAPGLAANVMGGAVTASGSSCAITAIVGGIITAATCAP